MNGNSTENFIDIEAPPDLIYRALLDPEAIVCWQVPENMTARIRDFRKGVGGGYEMTLSYTEPDHTVKGKTREHEDRYQARFVELAPGNKVIQAIHFDTGDPTLEGEMIMEIRLEPGKGHTRVVFLFNNIPRGIRPEDNREGTRSSLKKLAAYVTGRL